MEQRYRSRRDPLPPKPIQPMRTPTSRTSAPQAAAGPLIARYVEEDDNDYLVGDPWSSRTARVPKRRAFAESSSPEQRRRTASEQLSLVIVRTHRSRLWRYRRHCAWGHCHPSSIDPISPTFQSHPSVATSPTCSTHIRRSESPPGGGNQGAHAVARRAGARPLGDAAGRAVLYAILAMR